MSKHTPVPWRVSGGFNMKVRAGESTEIADCAGDDAPKTASECAANAAFIVRACNAHDDMLAACRSAVVYLHEFLKGWAGKERREQADHDLIDPIRQAIAKATGASDA